MAGEAEKKRQKRNGEILFLLRVGTLAALAVYGLLRFLVFAWPSRWVSVSFAFVTGLDLVLL
jgi:hypothetical protein